MHEEKFFDAVRFLEHGQRPVKIRGDVGILEMLPPQKGVGPGLEIRIYEHPRTFLKEPTVLRGLWLYLYPRFAL
jgi:hypothetical protein